MFNKKILKTTILEIIFTIILIFLLIFIRQKALNYAYDIQSFTENIGGIQQELQKQNLTSYDKEQLQLTLSDFDSILNKALILIQVILPASIFILSLIFYFLIWKITVNISIKNFLKYSIIPLILLLLTVYFTLNYIAYKYYFIEESSLGYLIISSILLVISYYISLYKLSTKRPLKLLKNLILPYILIIVTNKIYILLVFYLFFLTFVKENIVIPSILLLIIITIINFQRIDIVNKASKIGKI